MQLDIVIELRFEFCITLLVTEGINIILKRIQHPVVRSLDTPRITGANCNRLLQFTKRLTRIPHIRRRERIKIGLIGNGVRRFPVAVTVGVFATQPQFDRPVFAKLFADRDIRRSHVLIIDEVRRLGTRTYTVDHRVGGHSIVRS